MPKLKNVTNEDLMSAMQAIDEVQFLIMDLADTIRKGYSDPIDKPMEKARAFAVLAKSAADLSGAILTQAGMDERVRQTEELVKARLLAS